MLCAVIDFSARCNAYTTDLCGKRVGDVVVVQVRRREHVELRRPRQRLLEEDIGDNVFYQYTTVGSFFLTGCGVFLPCDDPVAVFFLCELVPPLSEGALCKLLYVSLVNEDHAPAAVSDRVLKGCVDQPPDARCAYRLDADSRIFGNIPAVVRPHEREQLFRVFVSLLELEARINILGIFTEDDHIHELWCFTGEGTPLK